MPRPKASIRPGNGLQKVKRDSDINKYESVDKFEALDIKLASAFKPVLSKRLNLSVTQK